MNKYAHIKAQLSFTLLLPPPNKYGRMKEFSFVHVSEPALHIQLFLSSTNHRGKIKINEKALICLSACFMEIQYLELPFHRQKVPWYQRTICVLVKSHLCKEPGQASGTAANTEKLGQQQETLHLRVVRNGCIAKSNIKNYHSVIMKENSQIIK